jgi:hypothetical protein
MYSVASMVAMCVRELDSSSAVATTRVSPRCSDRWLHPALGDEPVVMGGDLVLADMKARSATVGA